MVECMGEGADSMGSVPRILVIGDPEDMFQSSAMQRLPQLQLDGRLEFEVIFPIQLGGAESEEEKSLITAEFEQEVRKRLGECHALICRPTTAGKVTELMVRDVKLPFCIATLSKGTNHIQITEDKLRRPGGAADARERITLIHASDENAPAVAELAVHLANLLLRPLHRYAWLVNNRRFDIRSSRGSRRLEGLTWLSVGAGPQVGYLTERLLNWRLRRFIVQTRSMDSDYFKKLVKPVLRYLHGGDENKPSGYFKKVARPILRYLHERKINRMLDRAGELMSLDLPSMGVGRMTFSGIRDMDAALQEADVVSIHLPLVPETTGLFDRERISKMRRGAYLINVSRGGIVDEGAVLDALNDKHLAGYAADVIAEAAEESKDPNDSVLWQKTILEHKAFSADAGRDPSMAVDLEAYTNTILTPHAGGNTRDATEAVAGSVVGSLLVELGLEAA